jgi:hypothetical protein
VKGLEPELEERICKAWKTLIKIAVERKKDFATNAAEAMRFYGSRNHNFMFEGRPDFMVTVNKVYELVSLFGPHLYSQDPKRNVIPSETGNPQIAEALNRFLNYTPGEFGLKTNSQQGINDALISGRGCLFTGIQGKTGFPVSVAEHSSNILVDPSSDIWYNGWFVIRIRRDRPLWDIAEKFGSHVAERLRETSAEAADELLGKPIEHRDPGFDAEASGKVKRYDAPRATYVEVYSKMGVGLRGVKADDDAWVKGKDSPPNVVVVFEPTKNVVFHIGPWPIPFWADDNKHSWPISLVDPAESRDVTWPISLITPALGEQRWLNWAATYLLAQTKVTSRLILVTPTNIPTALETVLKGNKTNVVVKADTTDPDVLKTWITKIELPQLDPQFIPQMRYVEELFEKATGLHEIMYGQTQKQYRSAEEARLKGSFTRARIDAIVERVEDWQSEVARKEAIAARWLLDGPAIAPIVGPELAQAWDYYRQGDLQSMIREYDYSIISGSMRKRTPQYRADVAGEALERFGEIWIQTQNIEALNQQMLEWYRAQGVPNPQRFMLKALPPPPQEEQPEPQPPAAPEVSEIRGGEPIMGGPIGE